MLDTTVTPMRFSASRIQSWMTCPLQAKFSYIDKLPDQQNSAATFGSCVHDALHLYNTLCVSKPGDGTNVEQAVARFLENWEDPERINRKIEVWTKGATFGGMREAGIKMLRDYDEFTQLDDRLIIAAEHHFQVPLGDYVLHGFVDLIEIRKNKRGDREVHIVDYKTNNKQPYVNVLNQNIQFTCYAYAARQPEFWTGHETIGTGDDAEVFPSLCTEEFWALNIRDLPVRPIWYQLKNSKRIDAGLRDYKDFNRLHRVADEIAKAIEAEVYIPNISGESCTFCPYQEPCGLPIKRYTEDDEW